MAEWPTVEAEALRFHARMVGHHVDGLDVLAALHATGRVAESLGAVAASLVEVATDEEALSPKVVADALGVPTSTLRWLRAQTKAGGR